MGGGCGNKAERAAHKTFVLNSAETFFLREHVKELKI